MSTELKAGGASQGNAWTALSGESVEVVCRAPEKNRVMLSRAVQDRFQCPSGFLDFTLNDDLSSEKGYFQFGQDVVCYGRSSGDVSQRRFATSLHDALEETVLGDAAVGVPFDPDEVIDNLRLERYPESQSRGFEGVLKKLYYLLRPLTNSSVRHGIQQFHTRNWKQISFPHWPVDTTVENFCERLMLLSLQAKGVERLPFVWFWPKGTRGCLAMTHDVETTAGRDFCGQLMDMDEAAGIKASFQVVPEQRYEVPPQFLRSIRDRGFDIGIQDLNHDGRLFDSKEEFLSRAKIINRYGREYGARGFRAGVLYRKPDWFDALDFAFDMSIPNVAHLDPQRGGCCTVMPYFIGDILEIPVTTTQDYTLFHILGQRSIDLWRTQAETILGKNGLVSFIVHPDYVIEPAVKALYSELLDYLQCLRERENLWVALPSEIERWWRARSNMSVVSHGGSFRIEGEGAEQAVLAFASNVNGKLRYEFADASEAC